MTRGITCNIALDTEGRITKRNLENTIYYSYNQEGQQTAKRVVLADGTETTYTYSHPEDGNVISVLPTGVTSHSKTDSFGRKTFDELQLGTGFVSRQFSYHAGAIPEVHKENGKLKSTATTQLVSQILFADGTTLSYEYDEEERITKVTEKVGEVETVTAYTYDAMGQLLTETVNNEPVKIGRAHV